MRVMVQHLPRNATGDGHDGGHQWGKQQKPIDQSELSGLLDAFKIYPKMQRNDDGSNRWGYNRAYLEPLWKRYPRQTPNSDT